MPVPLSVLISSNIPNPIPPFFSTVTLTCTVELSRLPLVDVPVTVTTEWTGPDGFMVTNTAQPVVGNGTNYISTTNISSMTFRRDQSGNYTCTAIVTSSSLYILSGTKSGVAMLVVGKILPMLTFQCEYVN